jgi:hypothetical protein
MKKAYRHLAQYAIHASCTVSVWDGEEWSLKRSTSLKAICEEIEGVEEAHIRIRDAAGAVIATALVSAYGLAHDETVIDHTDNEWMSKWWASTLRPSLT